jgi:DNA-binding beta-propeller fold protein YncE
LRTVARVALSGPAVRFDYTSLDPSLNRLWISHMNASQLLAFDVRRRRIVLTIPAPGVHGVLVVPEIGRVYASATDAQEVFTIDSHTGAVLARAPAGQYPDGLAWDPVERHVFISDERGGVETVIDANGKRLVTIPLGGEAGNVQYDAGSGHILVDVQTRNDVAVIDPRTNKIIKRVPTPGCASDHGLYVDSSRRLAFVACDGNATLHVLDLRTMTFTGSWSVGGAPDVLAFDPSLRRLYVSAESGVVAVFAETAHGAKRLGLAFLAPRAHTVAVDPRTHLVYFPLESGSTGGPQLLIMKPASGPTAGGVATTGLVTTGKSSKGAGTTTPGSSIPAAGPAAGGGGYAGDPECPPGQTIRGVVGPNGDDGDSEDADDQGGPTDGDGCI